MYEYQAKVIKVIDADTVDLMIDLGFKTSTIKRIRIYDYDAPEVRLYSGVTEEQKALGLEAKEYAEQLLIGKSFKVKTHYDKTGKYGRYLADIILSDGVSYSEHMKSLNYVKEN